jgi:hypothetical protein
MKRTVWIFCFLVVALCINAQGIYTKVMKYDKFDDVVWSKNIKTLITQTDTTFVFETKGLKPETYFYVDAPLMAIHDGSRDSLVNLVADIWGYESQYFAVTNKIREDVRAETQKQISDMNDTELTDEEAGVLLAANLFKRIEELPVITTRTISKYRFTYEYETDFVWIKFKDGSRIVYSKY